MTELVRMALYADVHPDEVENFKKGGYLVVETEEPETGEGEPETGEGEPETGEGEQSQETTKRGKKQ